jgi:hypothetical protein
VATGVNKSNHPKNRTQSLLISFATLTSYIQY